MRFFHDLRFRRVFFAFSFSSDTQIAFPKIRCVSETFFAHRKRKSPFLKFRRVRQGRPRKRNLRFRSVSGNVRGKHLWKRKKRIGNVIHVSDHALKVQTIEGHSWKRDLRFHTQISFPSLSPRFFGNAQSVSETPREFPQLPAAGNLHKFRFQYVFDAFSLGFVKNPERFQCVSDNVSGNVSNAFPLLPSETH